MTTKSLPIKSSTGLDADSEVGETTLLIDAIAVAKNEELVKILLEHGKGTIHNSEFYNGIFKVNVNYSSCSEFVLPNFIVHFT